MAAGALLKQKEEEEKTTPSVFEDWICLRDLYQSILAPMFCFYGT